MLTREDFERNHYWSAWDFLRRFGGVLLAMQCPRRHRGAYVMFMLKEHDALDPGLSERMRHDVDTRAL